MLLARSAAKSILTTLRAATVAPPAVLANVVHTNPSYAANAL